MSIRVVHLTNCLHQALHAAMIRLVMPARLHKKQDELVELEQGLLGALERPRFGPTLPVDARDADAVGPRGKRAAVF